MCWGLTTLTGKTSEWRKYSYSPGVLERGRGARSIYNTHLGFLPSQLLHVLVLTYLPTHTPDFLSHCLQWHHPIQLNATVNQMLFTHLGWWRPSFMVGTCTVLKTFNSSMQILTCLFYIHYIFILSNNRLCDIAHSVAYAIGSWNWKYAYTLLSHHVSEPFLRIY